MKAKEEGEPACVEGLPSSLPMKQELQWATRPELWVAHHARGEADTKQAQRVSPLRSKLTPPHLPRFVSGRLVDQPEQYSAAQLTDTIKPGTGHRRQPQSTAAPRGRRTGAEKQPQLCRSFVRKNTASRPAGPLAARHTMLPLTNIHSLIHIKVSRQLRLLVMGNAANRLAHGSGVDRCGGGIRLLSPGMARRSALCWGALPRCSDGLWRYVEWRSLAPLPFAAEPSVSKMLPPGQP